jgi:hypothetical protein
MTTNHRLTDNEMELIADICAGRDEHHLSGHATIVLAHCSGLDVRTIRTITGCSEVTIRAAIRRHEIDSRRAR